MPRRLQKIGETLKLVGAKEAEKATRQHLPEEQNFSKGRKGRKGPRKSKP